MHENTNPAGWGLVILVLLGTLWDFISTRINWDLIFERMEQAVSWLFTVLVWVAGIAAVVAVIVWLCSVYERIMAWKGRMDQRLIVLEDECGRNKASINKTDYNLEKYEEKLRDVHKQIAALKAHTGVEIKEAIDNVS